MVIFREPSVARSKRLRYTFDVLSEVVPNCLSVSEVLRTLDAPSNPSVHSWVSKKIRDFNIDTSHFMRVAHNKGLPCPSRKTPEEIFIVLPDTITRRCETRYLRRALLESGVEEVCVLCSQLTVWNGADLQLEVDHIDGNWRNNLQSNLRFLCPNCHTQQATTKVRR